MEQEVKKEDLQETVADLQKTTERDFSKSPAVGIIQIDDKPATAIRYEKSEIDGQKKYEVSFTLDNKQVARLKNLDSTDLINAVGEKNASVIVADEKKNKGVLKGQSLHNEYGLSPEENARREAVKEARKAEENALKVAVEETLKARAEENARQAAADELRKAEEIARQVAADELRKAEESTLKVAVEETLKARAEENARQAAADELRKAGEISPQTMEALAAKRAAESAAASKELAEHRQEAINAIARDKPTPELSKAKQADKGQNEVRSDEVFSTAESDRLPIVPQEVAAKYLKVGDKYHFQRNHDEVAFHDKGNKLETKTNSPAVAESMVQIAQARGWDEIRISGSETFKREVWLEAAARGMHVRGFNPTDADKAKLVAMQNKPEFRARETANVVEGTKTRGQEMAEAFKNEKPDAALQKYPELAGAYAGVESIRRKIEADKYTQSEVKIIMDEVNKKALQSIEKNIIPKINVVEKTQEKTKDRENEKPHQRERELDR